MSEGCEGLPQEIIASFDRLPKGYCVGRYGGRRYGVTWRVSEDGNRAWLYAEELGGGNIVSCNLYRTKSHTLLKPCEMSDRKVIDFVSGFVPDDQKTVKP